MRKPFILNPRLNEIYKSEQNKYMATRLEKAKPLVKIDCPESFLFYKKQFHKPASKESICK